MKSVLAGIFFYCSGVESLVSPRMVVNIMLIYIYELEEGIAIGRPPSAIGGIPPVLQYLKKYFNFFKQSNRQLEPPLPVNFSCMGTPEICSSSELFH